MIYYEIECSGIGKNDFRAAADFERILSDEIRRQLAIDRGCSRSDNGSDKMVSVFDFERSVVARLNVQIGPLVSERYSNNSNWLRQIGSWIL